MKNSNIKSYLLMLVCFMSISVSCKKENEWLAKKSDKATVVPETLKDYQALFDNVYISNRFYSSIGIAATDNYFVSDEDLGNLNESDRNIYKWEKNIAWNNGSSDDWNSPFTVIEYANIVLDGLNELDQSQIGLRNLIGQAYFYRAYAYLSLSQSFCKPYIKSTSNTDLGVPIRLSSDVNKLEKRSNLESLYAQIISDAKSAVDYLDDIPKYIQRPSKLAADALLARVYLLMDNYEMAEKFADEVLKSRNTLINFNDPLQVSHTFTYNFRDQGLGNPEIIFFAFSQDINPFALNYLGNYVQADINLYNLYESNDLRKEYFFGKNNNSINYTGTYTGIGYGFEGLGLNEILLIRSESRARLGKVDGALNDLNYLLLNRYITGTFTPVSISDPEVLLQKILLERRKELANTGNIRWEDLRRLNKDARFQVTLKRVINGVEISLPPNDPRYVLSIPENEIRISGIEQNIR